MHNLEQRFAYSRCLIIVEFVEICNRMYQNISLGGSGGIVLPNFLQELN